MSEPSSPASAPLAERAVQLARRWMTEAAGAETDPAAARLAALLSDADGRRFAIDVAEGVMRRGSLSAAASQLRRSAPAVPESLPWYVRGAVRVGGGVAPVLPVPVVPITRLMLRETLRPLVADGRASRLGADIERISGPQGRGIRLDLEPLGARVLGEAEARRRLDGIHDLIRREDVGHVVLTVTEAVGDVADWAFDETVERAVERLMPLFLTAVGAGVVITLDVRAHRDLDLTIAVFTRLLEQDRLAALEAAITLPTALPDALPALQELTAWAQDRVDHGGAAITVRLARGVDTAAERAEALLHGWTPAPYDSALDAEANRLRCLDWALRPERTRAVRVGVVGDDPCTAAYAWLRAQDQGVADAVGIELTHGVAPGLAPAIALETGGVLIRAAVVAPVDVDVAIGRVVRAIDADGASGEGPGDRRFLAALNRSVEPSLRTGPRRTQDRAAPVHESARPVVAVPHADEKLTQAVLGIARGSDDQSFFETAVYSEREIPADAGGAPGFANSADSDPSLPANREWARAVFARIAVAEEATATDAGSAEEAAVQEVVAGVCDAGAGWGSRPASERSEILMRAAAALEGARGDLIALAASETGVLFADADAEVGSVIDLSRYYAATARELDAIAGAAFVPAAATLVVSSWRSPLADAADGALAALAAGSGVVLMPDPRAHRSAAALAETLWQAGIPRDVLALVDGAHEHVVITHPAIDRVILSGTREHAGRLAARRPDVPLLGRACGRSAIIVTGSADVDQAASDIVRSAFARAGQSAEAAGVVILAGAAGRSKRLARQLADAARSLHTGWPADPRSQVGPLIEKPQGAVERALIELDGDEEWLVRPRLVGADPAGRLWSPGIRIGVRADSRLLADDQAAPVLAVLHAPTLERAIELQNAVGTGLAAGLHSRDPEELALWLDRVEAGSLYVNRSTVGAMVQRQPFGGWAESSVGPGAKSGGPNRLIALGSWRSRPSSALSSTLHLRGLDSRITALIEAAQPSLGYEEFEWLRRAALSDALAWDREFGRVRDVSRLGVERDLLRYRPVPAEVRVAADARLQELLRVVIAAVRAGSGLVLSVPEGLPAEVRHVLGELDVAVRLESDEEWLERRSRPVPAEEGEPRPERVRLVGEADAVAALRARLVEASPDPLDQVIHDGEVTSAGRIELLAFVREQSISIAALSAGAPDHWSAAVI